ncbi:hypothetical protein C8R46DRAFT_1264237 [Mycena filopes]|nr:hypothetical protein C8R46DRAFT_1264237 [Mycena filopes]
MSLCFDTMALSALVIPKDALVSVSERKARPVGFVLDAHAVSPDFDSRPISPISACSDASDSSDDSTSKAVGVGRKRNSVVPTAPAPWTPESKTVGFGRKQRNSLAVPPSAETISHRKLENRRSLPTPVIPRDAPSQRLPRRFSVDLGALESSRRPAGFLGTTRQPLKPLLLAQQVQLEARVETFPARVRRCLAARFPRPAHFVASGVATERLLPTVAEAAQALKDFGLAWRISHTLFIPGKRQLSHRTPKRFTVNTANGNSNPHFEDGWSARHDTMATAEHANDFTIHDLYDQHGWSDGALSANGSSHRTPARFFACSRLFAACSLMVSPRQPAPRSRHPRTRPPSGGARPVQARLSLDSWPGSV